MERYFSILLFLLLISTVLTSCGLTMPRPEIRGGNFNVSVTYEVGGEEKTVQATYVCEYDSISYTLEGTCYRSWKGHFEGGITEDVIKICDTEDGGEIILAFLIYPEYFMGEPDYIEDFAPMATLSIFYYDEETGISTDQCDDEEVIAGYGVRLIRLEYDEPIENTFK